MGRVQTGRKAADPLYGRFKNFEHDMINGEVVRLDGDPPGTALITLTARSTADIAKARRQSRLAGLAYDLAPPPP